MSKDLLWLGGFFIGLGMGQWFWPALTRWIKRRRKRMLTTSGGFMASDKGKRVMVQGVAHTVAEVESSYVVRIKLAKPKRWWRR